MNERNRIYKRAATMRQGGRRRAPRRRRWAETDAAQCERRKPQTSLHELALRVLAQQEAEAAAFESPAEGSSTRTGLVIGIDATQCDVVAGGETLVCRLHETVRRRHGLAVGDRVLVRQNPSGATVTGVLDRTTTLSRTDPHNPRLERVIVANVDRVVVVTTLAQPKVGLLERFVIAIEHGGALPVVCANKTDLAAADKRDATATALATFAERRIPVVLCSAETGEGIAALRAAIHGSLCAFVGQSGVGKSSLLGALLPEVGAATAATRDSDGKGRHTTTRSTLYDLDAATRVIDTPGIRALGLTRLGDRELRGFFPDLRLYEGACRFSDCSHSHEPGCEVRAAVRDGRLCEDRWLTYLRILGES